MDNAFVVMVIEAYGEIVRIALPICLFIASCNIGINIIVSAFTGGRLHIGGK